MQNIQFDEPCEKDIKSMRWIPIQDYSELFLISEKDIYSRDIEIYVDLIMRKIAREFRVDYNYVKDIIREENKPFFLAKQQFFAEEDFYRMSVARDAKALENLFKLFYIPTINDDSENVVNVDKVVNLFNSLSNMDRFEFLIRIEKVSVKVDTIK